MAPLSSAVLATVSRLTPAQIGNAAGVAAIGAVFLRSNRTSRLVLRCLQRRRCLRCRYGLCRIPDMDASVTG
jgi:hypothetical protein